MKIQDEDESYSIITFDDLTEKEATELRIKLIDDLSVFVDGYKFSPKFRSGIWDGKKYYFKMMVDMSMKIPKGLAETISKRYNKFLSEPYTPINSPELYTEEQIQNHIKSLQLPFEPYDYQVDALREVLVNPRRILQSATGSGKSLIIFLIMTFFESVGKKGLLIVPNIGLAEQMKSDFISYGMSELDVERKLHIIFSGREKTFKKPITVTTWQSGILMKSQEYDQLDYVIIDECHLATGDSLNKLLNYSKNCLYKIGLTGTLPKTYEGRFTLSAALGKSKKIITAQGLIERGLATPVSIITVYLNYGKNDKKKVKSLKTFQKEVKFIEEHKNRNDLIAKMAIHSTKKYGNSLIMYNSIAHGNFLLELILKNKFDIESPTILEKITPKRVKDYKEKRNGCEDLFVLTPLSKKDMKILLKEFSASDIENIRVLSDYHIYLIKGSIEGETRNKIRELLENVDDGMLLGSAATVSTGMNVKRIHNFFAASSTKSSIRLNQSIGRGMRLHNEKEKMRYFDFIDDFSNETKSGRVINKNYVLKHSYERLNEYIENGYPIKELEIDIQED